MYSIIIKNLQAYVNSDEIYQKYKNKQLKEISDFEMFCINHCKNIEELIQDYTRQKQINEEDKNINAELREKVRMLDEAYTGVIKESKKWFDIAHNSIPKQKIKDKTEEIKEEYELLLEHQSGKESNRTKYLRGKIHMGQELLQESEDK